MAKNNKKMLVEKRNILNDITSINTNLQEMRFLSIYLAVINPRRPEETRRLRLSLKDFVVIMEIKGNISVAYIEKITAKLLQKIVRLRTPTGGRILFQLFKKCIIDQDKNTGEWFIDFDAHDEALPLMFDFKREYTTYELWNVLQLKSVNQFRMYEILKQYENLEERTIKLEELKSLLGIEKNEYPLWQTFKIDVLNVCQEALKTYTDIKFEWEVSKRGQRGKITELRFFISKNEDYKDVLNLDLFLKNYAYQENQELTYKECDSETDFNPSTNSFKVNGTNVNTQKKKITTEEMEFAQNHNLWRYAMQIAQKNDGVKTPIPYATKILFTWLSKGYQDKNDLVRAGAIQGKVTSYDLSDVYEKFE